LYHQRLGPGARRDRVLGQRSLPAGERAGPVERLPGAARARRQPLLQLGLHADDGPGLEPEGLAGAALTGTTGTLAGATGGGEADASETGVPDVRELLA